MRVIVPLLVVALAASSCGGESNPSPSPGPGPGTPSSPGRRLAWTQGAPTLDVLLGYTFSLYIDGTKTPLAGVSCSLVGAGYECTAPLTAVSAGRHVLELAATDPNSGRDSDRSAPLTITQTTQASQDDGRLASAVPASLPNPGGEPSPVAAFTETCVAGRTSPCFSTSVIAGDVGPIERLVALPDGRLLASYGGGIVRILPDGLLDRLDIGRAREAVDVADIAIDPDFLANRLVYLATVGGSGDHRTVSVVRMRELADRLGEAATIASDLPGGDGRPAISMGPDRRVYVAIPSFDRDRNGRARDPYNGLVLRLTRDGQAAGLERARSPIFSIGSARPVALVWPDGSHFLLGSSDGFGVVRVDSGQDAWPAAMTSLPFPSANGLRVVKAVATGQAKDDSTTLFVLGDSPQVLYVGQLVAGARSEIRSMDPIPLGDLRPVALAVTSDGTAVIAATTETGRGPVRLLRLQPR